MSIKIIPVHTEIFQPCQDLISFLNTSLSRSGISLHDGDVLGIASKIVALSEGRVRKLADIEPSRRALILSRKSGLPSGLVQAIIDEADDVYGYVDKAILTQKLGMLIANAGIDRKNAEPGYAILWPRNPDQSARKILAAISSSRRKRLGVIIVDSRVSPLRLGTTGFALGVAGFQPVLDCRNRTDIFGKKLLVTRHSVADDIASALHLAMGETAEQNPIAVARNCSLIFGQTRASLLRIQASRCLIMRGIKRTT